MVTDVDVKPRRWLNSQAALVAQVWLLSRAAMAVLWISLSISLDEAPISLLTRWDVLHYMGIGESGYLAANSEAFFPGLPILLRAGSLIGLPMEISGVVFSLLGSALATAALYRLFGAPAACLWALAPTAIFTVIGYTEGLFCAAAFWSWQRAKSQVWWQAAVLAGLACSLRVSGLFLVCALAVMALGQGRGWWKKLAWLLIPVAVLAAFQIYLHALTGSWMAWLESQQAGWTRSFTTPWQSLLHTLNACQTSAWEGRLEVPWVFRAEIVSMAAGLVASIWQLWRRHWPEAVFVGSQVLVFACSWWFMSVNRALLLWFPVWAMLGLVVKRANRPRVSRWWRLAVGFGFVLEAAVMLIWAWLFMTGRWAS